MASTYIDQRLITLSSDNATLNNGTFLSDVYFNFKGLIKQDTDIQEIQISVQNAQIPSSFYNVNVYNNILQITYNATPYTLTLTRGNYNSTTLINEIIAKLALQAITDITIAISSTTGILTFTRAGALNFTIDSTGTLNKVLGFAVGTSYTSVGGILLAPFPLNLLGLLKLKLASYEIQTRNYDSSVQSNLNILATIPIESGNFGLILYDNISNTQSIINNPTLDGFDLQIYGDDNNLVNFNGIGWNITLLLAITRIRQEATKTAFEDIVKPITQLIGVLEGQQAPQDTEAPDTEAPDTEVVPTASDANDEDNLEVLFYNRRQYL